MSTLSPSNYYYTSASNTHGRVDPQYDLKGSDLDIVSTDNVHFRIHKYAIIAASTVLRDMISICPETHGSNIVRLSDTIIENSQTIKSFLCIIYGKPQFKPLNEKDLDSIENLIQIILKYEAIIALQPIRTYLNMWFMQDINGSNANGYFLLACMIYDEDLACLAIRSGSKKSQSNYISPTVQHDNTRFPSYGPVDLSSWDLTTFKRIPDEFTLAFFKAVEQSKPGYGGAYGNTPQRDWEKIADRFSAILKDVNREAAAAKWNNEYQRLMKNMHSILR